MMFFSACCGVLVREVLDISSFSAFVWMSWCVEDVGGCWLVFGFVLPSVPCVQVVGKVAGPMACWWVCLSASNCLTASPGATEALQWGRDSVRPRIGPF